MSSRRSGRGVGLELAREAGSDVDPTGSQFDELYRAWMRRGQGGEPELVLAETDEAVRVGTFDAVPGAAQRIAYCRSAVALRLDDVDLALAEADRVVALAREDGSSTFEAVGFAIRSMALSRGGRTALAVEALARTEALIESGAGLDRDAANTWATARNAHGVACARLGLYDRAVDVLSRWLAGWDAAPSDFTRLVPVSNLARWRLVEALAALRTPPYRLAPAAFEAACSEAIEAGRAVPPGGIGVPWLDIPLWECLRAAWAGDPAQAVPALDPYLHRRRQVDLGELWQIAHAARLRALSRLGRSQDLQAVLEEDDLQLAGRHDSHASGGTLILLWERSRAQHPELERPDTALGGLELAHERQRAERQAAMNDVLALRVEQLRGDGERQRLTEANRTDHLTGVLNRRGFEPLMQTAAHAPPGPVALMMVDIDSFKRVNDTRGHVVGDETLRRLGEALSHAARGDDVVARLGGDEFVVLARLQGEEEAGAQVLADRILDSARRTLRDWAGITVSLGCAIRAEPVDSQAWLKLADGAMYSAKRAGGDQMSLVRC